MKKFLVQFLKLTLVAGLLFLLAKKGLLSMEALGRALGRPDLWMPAVLILFVGSILGAIRWQLLLLFQGIRISWLKVFELAYIGTFFNNALPGAVSGDVVKAFYIAKQLPGVRGRAFGAILFDRILGLSALVFLYSLGYFLKRETGPEAFFQGIAPLVWVSLFGVLGFYLYLFLVRESFDPVLKLFQRFEKMHARFGSLTRTYEGIRHYHRGFGVVLLALLISLVIHSMVCVACFLFMRALEGGAPLPFDALLMGITVPIGLLFTAIPLAPAGVGTGHAAFGWLFHLLGTDRGADLFSLFALNNLFLGSLGGIVYLRFKHEVKDLSALSSQ